VRKKGRHAQAADQQSGVSFAEWSYYVIWVSSLIAEGFIVKFLLKLAHKMAPPTFGTWIAMVLFFVGLTGLSLLYYFILTKSGAKLHTVLRWLSSWQRWPHGLAYLGFILGTLLGSSIGLAEIYKAESTNSTRLSVKLIVVSAAIFSVAWVPVFVAS
jgi:hypothetical protein